MDSGWTLGNLIEGQALDDASLIGLLGKATYPPVKFSAPRSGEVTNGRLRRRFACQYWPYWFRKAPGTKASGTRPLATSSNSKP